MHAVTVTDTMKEGGRGRKREEKDSRSSIVLRGRKGGYRGGKWPYNFSYIRACIARGGDSSCKARFELGSPPNRFLLRVVTPLVWTRATIPLHSPPARPKIRGLLRRIAWIEIRLAAVRSDRTFKFPPLGYSNE